jgi:hypothetical protein
MFLKEPRMGVAAALLLLLPIVGCGGDEVEPEPTPVPTTVEITPDAVELLSSGATTGLNAVVRDQNGKAMPNATVTWTGSDAAVFTVAGDGLIATVTAVANGMGTVTATAGQASGTASVTVVQTPAKLDVISGDEQEALRGTALAEPLVVRVAEQTGGVVPGVAVTFAPADERSGSASPSEAVTDADGLATTVWTLGDARRQRMVATADELITAFRAAATADPPTPDYTLVGDPEPSRFDPLDSETVEISAHITNLGDGPSTGPFTVRFTVGAMELETVQVDPIEPDGMRTATITAGPFEAGEHLIGVGIDPDEEFEEWDEANNEGEAFLTVLRDQVIGLDDSEPVAGPTGSLLSFRVVVEEQLNQPLTVDLSGPNGDGDLYVDFNVVRPSSLFPARFQRRCYSWNFGTGEVCQFYPVREGTYYITVHAYSSFDDATLKVTTGVGPAEDFALELVMVDQGTASQNGIITQVAERYESMIGLGSSDLSLSSAAEVCAPGMPELASEPVDDIKVYVMIGPLDGAGNAVAMSGACYVRPGANGWAGMPALGAIVLDEADVAQLEADGVLEAVVTREMARALGFSRTAWNAHGFLQNPSLPEEPDADTHMNAPLVVAAFNAAGGEGYAGAKVPLENGAMEGISDAYWRASVFGNEVMTPYVTGDSQPLSRITLEALYEVGYELDVTMADPFTLAGARSARPRGIGKYYGIDLATYNGGVATVTMKSPVKKKK